MSIKYISLFLIVSIFIIIVAGIYMIHTYPGKVAAKRKHPQLKAIEVTSLTGLLFFPLWIFALIWAHSNAVLGNLYNTGDGILDADEPNTKGEKLAIDPPEQAQVETTENPKSTDNL